MTLLAWVIAWVAGVILICAFSAGAHADDDKE